MRGRKSIGFLAGIWLLVLGLAGSINVFAAVTEGKAGETLSGEYAVIVNTDTSDARSTGTLIFDDSGDSSTASYSVEAGTTSTALAEAADVSEKSANILTYNTRSEVSTQATTQYTVGEEKYIYRKNTVGKTYVCIGVGEHCYVWMDKDMKADYDAEGKTSLVAADMANVYDGQPYRILNTLAGGDLPWEDGSGKLSIVLETLNGASGQFQYDVGITAIHINTPAAASYVSGEMTRRNGLLVHEGQHAVFWLKTNFASSGRYMWINEGLAVAVMDYLWGGTDTNGWMNGIAGSTAIRNGSSLIYQAYRNDTAQDYGMPYLFVRYVIDRMAGSYEPMAVLPKFYTIDASSLSCEKYLEQVTGISFETLLTDFYTAVAAGENTGVYSFPGDRIAAKKAATFPVFSGNSNMKYSIPAASAIIVKLKDGNFTVPSDGDSQIVYHVVGSRTSAIKPAGGDGTKSSPYEIDSLDDLNLIEDNPGAYYRLTSDIQTQGRINFTVSYFSGNLDGNGHTIYGLKKPLIGRNQGKVQNLRVVADFDDDMQNVQGVITQYNEGNIENCMVTGTIRGYMGGNGAMAYPEFGGIAGENELSGVILGCTVKLDINLTMPPMKSWVGGIAGLNTGNINKCVSSGTISVTQANGEAYPVYVGGIAGEIRKFGAMGGVIKECLHAGKITVTAANNSVGQMCGIAADNVLNSTYGLNGHVVNCYGKSDQGNLAGGTGGTITTGGLLTEEQMKDSDSFVGWEFGTEWKISDDGIPERVENPEITSLEVRYNWTSCYVGEKPWYWGKLWINGTTESDITDDMISGFDSSKAGTTHVYVEYKGKQVEYSLEVLEPETSAISSIVISGRPKASYVEGDVFNPSGASMYATIGGRAAYIYSGFTYDKTEVLTTSDTQVTFDYFGAKIPYTISVAANGPAKLTMLAAPEKLSYVSGDKLDLTGLKLQITYSKGNLSPVITADKLDTYGIRMAIGSSGTSTAIDRDREVQASDNGKYLIFYATDKLPGDYGAVSAVAGTLSVTEPLAITGTELYVVTGTGKEQWVYTDDVTGGSGSYETRTVSENLPAGLTLFAAPSVSSYGSKYFTFSGTVTAPIGIYESKYEILDTKTGAVLPVTIKIVVTASNEARFYSFVLNKSLNSQLKEDVVGEIDNENYTITLRLPSGTDVTNLAPNIDYGSGTGAAVADGYTNGSRHDFTNPVEYVLTAPDGVTKVTYTVSVVFYDENPGSVTPTNTPEPTPTNTPEPTPTSTPEPTPTSTPEPTPTSTPEPTPTSTPEPTPTNTPEPTPTNTPEPTPTSTPEPTPTSMPEPTPTSTPEPTPTNTPKPTPTNTPGPTPTNTPELTPTNTPEPTPTSTPEPTPTNTPEPTPTSTSKPMPTSTPEPTPTSTPKPTSTNTSVPTATPIPTTAPVPTAAPMNTPAPAGYSVGTTVKSSQANGYYKVTGAQTVEYMKPVNKKASKVTIPDSVNLNGVNYKVTTIASKAFKNNKSLKTLTIGNNVVQIKKAAFYKCTKLTTVKIGKAVQSIGKQSFYGCKKLNTLRVYTTRLQSKYIGSSAFKGTPAKMKAYVPRKLAKSYKSIFLKKGMSKSVVLKKL